MASYKRRAQEADSDLLDAEEEFSEEPEYDKYIITVSIELKATDIDAAGDAIADMISEAIDKLGDNYKPDVVISDYDIDAEPAPVRI